MQFFLDTTDTIADGFGFAHFGNVHFVWLGIMLLTILGNCLMYRKLKYESKRIWRKVIAWLLIADELFKMTVLFLGKNYEVGYLPLHLCSINIILIAIHAYHPSKVIDNFLYTVCIPGALAAMLFPTWTALPICNGMHIHSFTVHILLMLYPVVLTVNHDIKPDVRQLPKTLGLLVAMAIPIYGINLLLDTNFMFLMSADAGNPLYLFQQMWGNHLLGFPVIIAGVLLVMYGPLILLRKIKKEKSALH